MTRLLSAGEMPHGRAKLAPTGGLYGTTALGGLLSLVMLATPQAARAADDCGAASGGAVTCAATGNPFPGGIIYTPTGDLTLTTDAAVNATNSISVIGGGVTHVTNNGTITTTGAGTNFTPGATGIIAVGTKGVIVDGNGAISTSGLNARGIDATSTGGTVSVNVGNVTTTGLGGGGPGFFPTSSAIFANTNAGAINVTAGTLSTTGDFARGVQAVSSTGDITVNTGAINTTGSNADGVFTSTYGTGNSVVTSTGTISTTGQTAKGLYVVARDGSATANAGDVTTTGFNAAGIAVTGGTAANASFGSITTNNLFSQGVVAQATGDVTVTGTNVTTNNVDSAGVYAFAGTGNATVTTTGTIATNAASSRGVYAYSNTGNASVTVNNVATAANDSQAIIVSGANASATVNGTVSTKGTAAFSSNGDAITVTATNGVATVVNNGSVSTAGNGSVGILATGTGGVTISGAGSVATTGDFAQAIYASSYAGHISITTGAVSTSGLASNAVNAESSSGPITVNTGAIATLGTGAVGVVAVSNNGDVAVITGSVTTSGTNAAGIIAMSNAGGVSVNAASVAVGGVESKGILAFGAGPVNVTSGTATAFDVAAIDATSTGGAATVTLNGVTSTGTGNAVSVNGATTATLDVGTGGALTPTGGAALLTSVNGSTVNNAGAISGNGTTGAAILTAVGGPLTLNNSGNFTGVVGFTAGNDRVVNTGLYRAQNSQDFGAGTDTFVNSGTFAALPGTTVPSTISFTGLETFSNSGVVDLRNGHAGDTLNLSSTFAGSGGSTLGVDVAFGAGKAATVSDVLITSGAITGSTGLIVAPMGPNGVLLNAGTVFAVGGAGSSANAFTVNPTTANQGFGYYNVNFNAANNSYSLFVTPGDAVFRGLKINEGAQQLWYKSAEAWSGHMSELRDSKFAGTGVAGGRLWGVIYGQTNTRETGQRFTTFGQSRNVDLSYRQDAFGGQLGFDLGSAGREGAVVFGVTGGYVSSDLSFRGSADRARYDVINGGAYASFVSGNLFANVLGKYDYYWVDSRSPLAGYDDRFHGRSYGAQGEVGIRVGSNSLYVEPLATIAFVRTSLNDLRALNSTIDFDRFDGLRGKFGARVGSKLPLGGGATAVLYAQGNYVHDFEGNNGLDFISNGFSLRYGSGRIRDYGEGKIGFSVASFGGVTGFVEGFGDYSNHYRGGGGRAGLRVGF